MEANDYECDVAKYVDTGDRVEDAGNIPAARSFGQWLDTLVTVVTGRPFTPVPRDDAVPGAFFPPR